MRAGGRYLHNDSNVSFMSISPEFRAIMSNPKENLMTWLTVLGNFTCERDGNKITINLKHKNQIYRCMLEDNGDTQIFSVYEIDPKDVVFISHLIQVSQVP